MIIWHTCKKNQQSSQGQVANGTAVLMQRCWPEARRAPCLGLCGVICGIIRQFDLNVSFSVHRWLQREPAVPLSFNLEGARPGELRIQTVRAMCSRFHSCMGGPVKSIHSRCKNNKKTSKTQCKTSNTKSKKYSPCC